MILKYVGPAPHLDSRFVAQPSDLVEFTDDEGRAKLTQEPELWKEAEADGDRGQGRGDSQRKRR